MEYLYTTMYVVKCCGCTDCFPHAVFVDEHKAKEWANANCRNPEGYIIEKCEDIGNLINNLNQF